MIEFKNVEYKIKDKIILSSINFVINSKEKVLIYGHSGSGKTTIFNLMCKHIKPTKGEILVNKTNIKSININKYRKHQITMISQVDDLKDNLSVFDNLTLYYKNDEVLEILKKCKLYHLKDQKVNYLSGGERQRIAIIKEMLSDVNIILCDEITSALDDNNAISMIDFIINNNTDKTIIFISHNPKIFEGKIDRYININNSKIINNTIINEVKESIEITHKNKRKNDLLIIFKQANKRVSVFSFIVIIILIICFYVSINFSDIFSYFAKKSYQQYFNYDVVSIKDNNSLINDDINIFYDATSLIKESKIKINKQNIVNPNFYPFNNKNDNSQIVVNSILVKRMNINKPINISIEINDNKFLFDNVDVIDENNTYSLPSIYFDFKYFNNITNYQGNDLLMVVKDFNLDDRFTNNPMFKEKKEDKPYIDSSAYQDYLTYQMIFESIKEIIDYYFVIILVYCFIVSTLINVSSLLKDIKNVSVYISKGFSKLLILLMYLFPKLIYTFIMFLLSMFINQIRSPLLYAFLIDLLSIIISYLYIISKPLYKNLKEDYLC